jgi:FkbM family methyltransferase
MVVIERVAPPGPASVGSICEFHVVGAAIQSVDFFLEHEGILYPDPLTTTRPDGSLELFVEVPGSYRLHASWQSTSGERGLARTDFRAGEYDAAPRVANAAGEKLWMPSSWDAQLLGAHESATFDELRRHIRPGAVAYDIGANVGLFSVWLARLIGAQGWLYALEPNPVCVYFLRANLARAGTSNYAILPLAAANSQTRCAFSLNYGSSMLGVGKDSPFAGKYGHRIDVGGESLDNLIERLEMRAPDFIKLDVEGAEASAVEGMMRTISGVKPLLMLELHGRTAAQDTLKLLADADYRYQLPGNGSQLFSNQSLVESLTDTCIQVIGVPSVNQ